MIVSAFEAASIKVDYLSDQRSIIKGLFNARKKGSRAVIAEFGLINPIWNLLVGKLMFRPNTCIISNVKHDNPFFNIEDYASSLLECAPVGCPVFSSDIAFMGSPSVTLVAKGKTDRERYRYVTEAALSHLGLSLVEMNTESGVNEYFIDGKTVSDGFGVNDLESIVKLLEKKGSDYSVIYSNRSDRAFRLDLLVPVLTDCGCSEVIVIGDDIPRCVSKLKAQVLGKPIFPFCGSVAETLSACSNDVVFIGGLTEQACEFIDFCRNSSLGN